MCSLVEAKFIEKGIAPEYVAKAPLELIKVVYPGKLQVNIGKELAPVQVKDQPEVSWDVEKGALYTLIFKDLDARLDDGPTFTFLHWVVGNIPGNDVGKGQVLCPYLGSAPTKGSGLHRYVFIVYKQPKKIEFEENLTEVEHRWRFSADDFATKHAFGRALFGNFYVAQSDAYAEEFHRKLAAASDASGKV